MMTYNKFNKNCPYFSVGNCCSYKNGACKYKYHKKCDQSFLCNREDCKFGHTIPYSKRVIINKIYDKKYSRISSPYENSDNRCNNPINCINKDCNCDHHLGYDDRAFIYNIINPTTDEDNAWSNYEKKYNSYSPSSSKMSSGSTIIATCPPSPLNVSSGSNIITTCSPLPVSFVSICKKEDDKEDDKEDNSIITIIKDMKNIRNNIDIDTKKIDNIKDQIKKLEEELINTEDKVKKNKDKLKELAIKIADC